MAKSRAHGFSVTQESGPHSMTKPSWADGFNDAAKSRRCLVEREFGVSLTGQFVGGRHPGDAAAEDGDAWFHWAAATGSCCRCASLVRDL